MEAVFIHKFYVELHSRTDPSERRNLSWEFAFHSQLSLMELVEKLRPLYKEWRIFELRIDSVVMREIEWGKPKDKPPLISVDVVEFILAHINGEAFRLPELMPQLMQMAPFDAWLPESLLAYTSTCVKKELAREQPRLEKISRGLYRRKIMEKIDE